MRARILAWVAVSGLACAASTPPRPADPRPPAATPADATVGTWSPGQMSESFVELDWDVSALAAAGEPLYAVFTYRRGAQAVAIHSVALLADGVEVSRDEHFGWTGRQTWGNVYALRAPAGKAAARWTLRARLRSDRGTDSSGDVRVSRTAPPPAPSPGNPAFAKSDLPGAEYFTGYVKGSMLAAHRAFAEGMYDEALRLYEEAKAGGPRGSMLDGIADVVKKRKALGEIRPEVVHQLCIVWITERRIRLADKMSVVPDVTDEMKARWMLHDAGVVKRLVETYSDGHATLELAFSDAWAEHDASDRFVYLGAEKIEAGEFYFANMDRCDTFAVSSTTASPGLGGLASQALVRGVFKGPERGGIQFNAKTHDAALLFHELFHVFEQAAPTGVPAHAFETADRKLVPGWTGEGEFDYYRWHYANTFPKKGWGRFDLSARKKTKPSDDLEAYRRVRALYDGIPVAERDRRNLRAGALTSAAGDRVKEGKTADAIALLREALERSPAHQPALDLLVELTKGEDAALVARQRDVKIVVDAAGGFRY